MHNRWVELLNHRSQWPRNLNCNHCFVFNNFTYLQPVLWPEETLPSTVVRPTFAFLVVINTTPLAPRDPINSRCIPIFQDFDTLNIH